MYVLCFYFNFDCVNGVCVLFLILVVIVCLVIVVRHLFFWKLL